MSIGDSQSNKEALKPQAWRRFLLFHGLQVVPILIVIFGEGLSRYVLAALLGSIICCLATDSGWRWRNRLFIAEATLWLLIGLLMLPLVNEVL